MANQLDLSNVLYINSNPLKVAETYSLLTSDILVYSINSQLYPGINTVTQYYNNTSNQLAFVSYYSTKNINTLLAAGNINGTSLVKVPVRSINGVPFGSSIDYLFPANGVQLREVTPTVTEIYFKNSAYITDTSIATIIAAANTGGGGGGTNPTNLFIPYNDAGVFEDSYLKNDTTVGAETLSTIFGGETKGLKFEFWDSFYALGDFGWADNGTSFIIDDAAKIVKTFYQGNDIGLKLDFANGNYLFGDEISANKASLIIAGGNIYAKEANVGYTAINIEPANSYVQLGDFNNNVYGTSFTVNDASQIIKTQNQGSDVGLKLDFASGLHSLGQNDVGILADVNNQQTIIGDYANNNNLNKLILDDLNNYIKTSNLGNDIGLKLDFANQEYCLVTNEIGVKANLVNNKFEIGDYGLSKNGNYFQVDDDNQVIQTHNNNIYTNYAGIKLDFENGLFYLGDFKETRFTTWFGVDDVNQQLIASNNLFLYTPGYVFSDNCIPIFIDNTLYYLPLFKP